jgi:hypothetical protein
MRLRMFFGVIGFGLSGLGVIHAQITANPFPAPIEKRGLTVEIRDVVRLPETRGMRPPDQDVNPAGWARISFVRDSPDGRRFVNDSRGFLYLLRDGKTSAYLDFTSQVPQHVNYSRLESGLIGFTFHPEFPKNGLLYTVHAEFARNNPAKPNFIPPGYTDAQVTHHNVITEWRAKNPSANTFEGTRRELLRVAHIVQNQSHPMGAVEFNPTAKPGSPDYGLLYTSGSDLGFSNGGGPHANNAGATQRLDSVIGAILRVDPRSPSESKETTRFLRRTDSPPTTTRRRSARSMPMASATPIGCRGTSPTAPCSPTISAWTTSRRSTSSATAVTTAG